MTTEGPMIAVAPPVSLTFCFDRIMHSVIPNLIFVNLKTNNRKAI